MVQDLNEETSNFNQDSLTRELTAALVMEHQLRAIMDDWISKTSSEQAKQLQKKILIAAQESIKGMLQATSKEVFMLQQQRFNQLIVGVKNQLNLEEDLEGPLEDYRFYRELLQVLRSATAENFKTLHEKLPTWFKEHEQYTHWKIELDFLKGESDARIFETHKNLLIEGLLANESHQQLANLMSIALIEQNNHMLADTRLSYLKETNNRKKLIADISWIGLGALLVAAAAVLSIAFPPLIIPGLVIGGAVLAYGAIDFIRNSAELYNELQLTPLGERKISSRTRDEIAQLEDQLNKGENTFIERQQLEKKHWSNEEKLVKGLGYTSSFLGFALAIAALSLIIPGVGAPIAAVITIAALSVAISVVAVSVLGTKLVREHQHQQKVQEKTEEKMAADKQVVTKISKLTHQPTTNKDLSHEESKQKKPVSPSKPLTEKAEEGDEEDESEGESFKR
ncbi:EI24 domain-containing protein [Legionella hackeliae]|uniref:IncA protein n=1 Tax=Legionella hackeliae TaxID=449 RepID=A0A0A8USG5_LEGHA|nr:EI24 domain-containing protein [Legionella hackeliae]KTD10519.1 IncA protein [Legionella hackeliae]CEK10022.1 membrane protein of unknown function [Legionella hackeliae]STX46746.1 IncA protein [Legionella hackeliae]